MRLVHGYYPDMAEKLVRYGRPDLAVFNSYSLLEAIDYHGSDAMVCHPWVRREDFFCDTTGDAITLVNCSEAKGVWIFDQIARYMPDRRFLAVKGGYGKQESLHRPNMTVMEVTRNMRTVYSQSRIVVMPSAHESWGMVGIEAFCSGIPVIAHPTPGLLEALGKAGIFAHRDSLDAWLDAIENLDKPNVYKRYSDRAKKRFAELENDDSAQRFVKRCEELV